jgi:ElaB/YqjD/DUF883 family membrane-anchored ribosome-binding protein
MFYSGGGIGHSKRVEPEPLEEPVKEISILTKEIRQVSREVNKSIREANRARSREQSRIEGKARKEAAIAEIKRVGAVLRSVETDLANVIRETEKKNAEINAETQRLIKKAQEVLKKAGKKSKKFKKSRKQRKSRKSKNY